MLKSHLKDTESDNMFQLQALDGTKIKKKQIKTIEGAKFYCPNKKWNKKQNDVFQKYKINDAH